MKKLSMTLGSIFLAGVVSLTAYANEASQEVPAPKALTEEQKKQIEAEHQEMQEKFNALTDEQKKEIYDLYDKVNVAKIKLLDKYVEFGLLTEEEVKSIQEHLSEISEKMRTEGKFIGFKGPHFPKNPENNSQTN